MDGCRSMIQIHTNIIRLNYYNLRKAIELFENFVKPNMKVFNHTYVYVLLPPIHVHVEHV